MSLPKCVSVREARAARVGDSFVVQRHTQAGGRSLRNEGLSFSTHQAWLVFKHDAPPQAVTVLTVTGGRT